MQFDIYRHRNGKHYPFLMEAQSNFINTPGRIFVFPVASVEKFPYSGQLYPVIQIEGENYRVVTTDGFSVPTSAVAEKIGDVSFHEAQIKDAIYRFFWGF